MFEKNVALAYTSFISIFFSVSEMIELGIKLHEVRF